MRESTKIKITPKGERSVKHGHPWVFGDEVIDIDGTYEAIEPYVTKHKLDMDEDEEITKVWIDLKEVQQMLQNNQIIDGKTIIALQYALLERRDVK